MRTDEELFELCRRRDARAWEQLVLRYQDRILGVAYQFCGNRDEARDLAQEVFIRVYRNMESYDPARSFRVWIYSVARNLCVDHYRRRRRERGRSDRPVEEFHDLAAGTEAPDARVLRREREAGLMRALDTLGAPAREAIVMKDLQHCTLEEMSDTLGLPLGTVKSRLSRARLELGKAILRLERGGEGADHAL